MKLIIDIPEVDYECAKQRWMRGNSAHMMDYYISKGTPLYSDSEQDEVQAYFAGMSYGWEEGRKDLIDDVKVKIENAITLYIGIVRYVEAEKVIKILDNIDKAESEEV